MAQWMNLHRNNSFVNWMQLPLLCEKSGAILLVLVGLTAGQQLNEILVDFENLEFSIDRIIRIFTKIQCYYIVLPMHFSWLFQINYIVKQARKSGTPCFLGQSSTTILNDKGLQLI